jgi:hypothetical protein
MSFFHAPVPATRLRELRPFQVYRLERQPRRRPLLRRLRRTLLARLPSRAIG